MRILGVCIFLFLMSNFAIGQQQQMYTQFMYNKLSLNPAYAGNNTYTSFALLYRDQWNGFPGAPKAQLFSINLPRISNRIGIGFNLERQNIGITEKITYEAMYAYKFFLGEGTLSMGINVGGRNFIQDFTDSRLNATQGLENDPAIPDTKQSRNLLNAGFGIYFNTNNYYLGASIPRMIKSDLDYDNNSVFSTEARHFLLMTGGTFILNNDWRLTPQLLFRIAENTPFGIDVNTSLSYKEKYTYGVTYRTGGTQGDIGESIDMILGIQISERMMVGFAYDIGLSKLRTVNNGSLEVILGYNFLPKKITTVSINPRYF